MQQRNCRVSGLIKLILSTIVLSAASGCAGPNAANMVPDADTQLALQTGKSVRTVTVRGEQDSVWGGAAYAKKEQIHTAAVETLTRSGVFSSIDAGRGDLDLEIIVRSQGQEVTSFLLQYTGKMTVTYRFTDTAGDAVWSTTLESSGSSKAFSGAKRTTEARERTVKANLTALLNELNKSWK